MAKLRKDIRFLMPAWIKAQLTEKLAAQRRRFPGSKPRVTRAWIATAKDGSTHWVAEIRTRFGGLRRWDYDGDQWRTGV